MKENKFENLSKNMYDVASNRNGLAYRDIDTEVYKKVMIDFICCKASKTDLKVLHNLMLDCWDLEKSIFKFKDFDEYLTRTFKEISKPNLSRSLKALETFGFIKKVKYEREITYHFLTAYKVLEKLC